jgi:hypothetical protein
MADLRAALYDIVATAAPMSVRQVFYQAVSRGLIAKTEAEYKNTVCRLLSEMRLEGEMPYGWIADGTRWQRKPVTHSGLEAALGSIHRTYRRSLWDNQSAYIEVWLEKEALAGVVYDATAQYDVPLMVTRGYPSLSFLANAAEDIEAEGVDSTRWPRTPSSRSSGWPSLPTRSMRWRCHFGPPSAPTAGLRDGWAAAWSWTPSPRAACAQW